MDALILRIHAPIVRSVSVFLGFELNVYAIMNLGEIKKWWRPSPLSLGVHWDILRWVFVAGEVNAVVTDIAGRMSGGVRF